MPRVKGSGTIWREFWSWSSSGQAVSCDDCGRPDLRVAYRCKTAPTVGNFCRRNRCWTCAGVKGVYNPPDWSRSSGQRCAVVEVPCCKACRAEVVFTGQEKSILSL